MENFNNENINTNTKDSKKIKNSIKNLFSEPNKFIIPTFILSCLCIILSVINLSFSLKPNRPKDQRFDKMYTQNTENNYNSNKKFNNYNDNSRDNNFKFPESKGPRVQNENIQPGR